MTADQWFDRSWGSARRAYEHVTLVRHAGQVIALSQDDRGAIYYSVLDPAVGDSDADGWSDDPKPLPFPSELVVVGFGALDVMRLRQFRTNGSLVTPGTDLAADQIDQRLSTTAVLTEAGAPLRAVSDDDHLYVFRQSADPAWAAAAVADAKPDADPAVRDMKDRELPVRGGTLLMDRFVLVGSELQNPVQVRFQRSRKRDMPADGRDTLGSKDLDGHLFVEPTQVVDFVRDLHDADFAPILVPTAVAGVDRWLIARRWREDQLDLVSCARTPDGLFDTVGVSGWRCPIHEHDFALAPGECPLPSPTDPAEPCGRARERIEPAAIWAGSALELGGSAHQSLTIRAGRGDASDGTVELWLRVEATHDGDLFSWSTAGRTLALRVDSDGTVTVRPPGASPVITAREVIVLGEWHHLAVVVDGDDVRVVVDGAVVGRGTTVAPPVGAKSTLVLDEIGLGTFHVDDVRIWSVPRRARLIREQLGIRLTGYEPSLQSYVRFDEEGGEVVRDLVYGVDHTVTSNRKDTVWVPSGARIAQAPGLTRTSMRLTGSSLTSGPAVVLYHQQTDITAGYAGTKKPAKTWPRLMIAVAATGTTGTTGTTGAVVDLGLHVDGGVAQPPTRLVLVAADAAAPPDTGAEDIRVLQAVLADPAATSLGASPDALAAIAAWTTARQRADEHRAARAADRATFEKGITTFWQNSAADDTKKGHPASDRPRLEYTGAFTEWDFRTTGGGRSLGGADADWSADVTSVTPGPFARVSISSRQRAWTEVVEWPQTETLLQHNDEADCWSAALSPKWVDSTAAEQKRLDDLTATARTALVALLDTAIAALSTSVGNRIALPLVAVDARGGTVAGALVRLPMTGAPVLFDSALGEVLLHTRDDRMQLRSTHFETGMLLSSAPMGGSGDLTVTVLPRRPELVGPGSALLVVLAEKGGVWTLTAKLTGPVAFEETWPGLSGDPVAFAAAVNRDSRLVTVAAGRGPDDTRDTTLTALFDSSSATTTGFRAAPRGSATALDGQGRLVAASGPLAREADLTIECWVNADAPTGALPQSIVSCGGDGGAGYALTMRGADDPGSPTRRAAHLGGHVGDRVIATVVPLRPGGWRHVAFTWQQRYGIHLDGDSARLRLGDTAPTLGLAGDMSIEVDLSLTTRNRDQALLSRGDLTDRTSGLPYALWIRSDNRVGFAYRDTDGTMHTFTSTATVPDRHTRVAVSRKAGSTNPVPGPESIAPDSQVRSQQMAVTPQVVVTFVVGDAPAERQTNDGAGGVRSASAPTWVGRAWSGASDGIPDVAALSATITRIALWSKARDTAYLGTPDPTDVQGLIAEFTFREGSGRTSTELRSSVVCRLDGSAEWTPSPDVTAHTGRLLVDGGVVATTHGPNTFVYGEDFAIGRRGSTPVEPGFVGSVEEVRVWRTVRTPEQIQDNMFRSLDSELEDLVGYWSFDGAAGSTGTVDDASGRGGRLTREGRVVVVASTAPIGHDGPQLMESGRSVPSRWTATALGAAAVAEYADLQKDGRGRLVGVFKRAYGYVTPDKRLHLATGFKVGDTTLEWVGQVQTDPQLMGFIEGAPPVPGENFRLDGGENDDGDYTGAATVRLSVAESTTVTSGHSVDEGMTVAVEDKLQGGYKNDALAGLTVMTRLSEVDITAGAQHTYSSRDGQLKETEDARGTSVSRTSSYSLTGQVQKGSAYRPANFGFALVQSSTADRFAMRLRPHGTVVSYTTRPSPDIPPDWNIITFAIDSTYTKQGVLDGKTGLLPDRDYPHAGSYSPDLSYFKPIEAYALKRRINEQEQVLLARYRQANPEQEERVDVRDVRRSMVNTYVWTADGGLFSEEMQSIDSVRESDSGTFSWEKAGGVAVETAAYFGGVGGKLELSALVGGYRETTVSKALDSESTFGIEVELDDLESDLSGEKDGAPVDRMPGKVDAYRFMTFYLDVDAEHFDLFYHRVVDPTWLQSNHPGARAMREAQQSVKRPRCWRVLHRVTYVSRVLAELGENSDPVDEAIKEADLGSNHELVKALDPYVGHRTGSVEDFTAAVDTALQRHCPTLRPHKAQILAWLSHYYGVGSGAAAPSPSVPTSSTEVFVEAPRSGVVGQEIRMRAVEVAEKGPSILPLFTWTVAPAATVRNVDDQHIGYTFDHAGTYRIAVTASRDEKVVGYGEKKIVIAAATA